MKPWPILGGALLALAAGGAAAHATLQSSSPRANESVPAAPAELRLQFNDALEPAFSSVRLVDPHGAEVGAAPSSVDAKDLKVMTLKLPALQPGAYSVRWSAMTRDGHRTTGSYVFTVKGQ